MSPLAAEETTLFIGESIPVDGFTETRVVAAVKVTGVAAAVAIIEMDASVAEIMLLNSLIKKLIRK